LALSPDGRWLAKSWEPKGGDVRVMLVDRATGRGKAILTAAHSPLLKGVAFSPDSRLLAVAPDHEAEIVFDRPPVPPDLVYLFEVPSGLEFGRLRGPDGSVRELAFSPDGRTIATAGPRGRARLWEVATLGERHTFRHGPTEPWVAFSRDG